MTKTPHKKTAVKFGLLVCLLLGYFGYLSLQYGLSTGGLVTALTWSFFVLCTPVADAGFLLDFPLRLLFGIRMLISEVVVWVIAIIINLGMMLISPETYTVTAVTNILYQIITTPFPYWTVIILSGLGTFLSVHFGDELMDVTHHRDKDYFHSYHFKQELILLAFFVIALVAYSNLISSVGLSEIIK